MDNNQSQGTSNGVKKIVIPIAIVALFLAAGGYLAYNNRAKAPTEDSTKTTQENTTTNPEPTPTESTPTTTPSGLGLKATFSTGEENPDGGADIQVVEIVFNGKAFEPSSVDIKVGDYVVFRNNSSIDFWPASAMHPSHLIYPEFDSKKAIAPGGKYQFQFDKAGNWKFHDHLTPSAYGVVNVTEK